MSGTQSAEWFENRRSVCLPGQIVRLSGLTTVHPLDPRLLNGYT